MDIRTQSTLLAAILGMALGLSMLLRATRPREVTRYSTFALTVGGYYFALFLDAVVPPAWRWLSQFATSGSLILGALVPSAALSFFLEFLQVRRNILRNGQRVAFLSAIFGLAVGLTPLSHAFWARVALSAWVLLSLTVSVSLLARRVAQVESRIERVRLRYLAYGAGATVLFAALDFLGRFGVPFPALGPIVSTLYLFFLAQTLLRLRLMDLHELLGKVASHAVLAAILASVFATLTIWVGGNLPLFVFNTIVAAFVMLILLEPLREKVEDRVIAIFFRERFELVRALTQLRARIATTIDVEDLARLVLDGLNETRRITHASLYLLAHDRPGYRLRDARGPQPASFLDQAMARGLLNAAASGQKAVLLENLERRIQDLRQNPAEHRRHRDEAKRLTDIRTAMTQMKAGITVPLVGNDRVIGFLNLWDERVPEAFASDEIAMLLDIAEQMAIVVENSNLYEKMRERDRLAALGEMAAGLAHEIRNPLGSIKGAAQCLDPRTLPGEDGEFLEVIVEEVNRLSGVVSAFLDYSRPLKQNFAPSDINDVVTRTLRLIQNEIPERITVELDLHDSLNKVNADPEQLKQVLINLVQNSLQAFNEGAGTITIRTARVERFSEFRGSSELIEVQVADTGPGIPPDQQPSIFVPFFTTKQKGTGLGLAICQRIVKNHGGTITVQSKVGEGSTFLVRLPAISTEAFPAFTPAPEGAPYPELPASPHLPPPPDLLLPADSAAGEDKSSRRQEKKKKRRAAG
jgi:two-component system, NtrC family, sensor histidine kinase HydH